MRVRAVLHNRKEFDSWLKTQGEHVPFEAVFEIRTWQESGKMQQEVLEAGVVRRHLKLLESA